MKHVHDYDASPIRHRDIRSVLMEEQLRQLEKASSRKSIKAGEPIFEEGDKTTHSFAVLSGTLKLTKLHPDGERHITGLMFGDDFLCGIFKPQQTCSAEAATDLELCAIPNEVLSTLCGEAPKLESVLFRAALSELEAGHDWVLLLRGCPAYQRVAGFLRLLARRAQPGREQHDGAIQARFTLPLSRAEIAGFLGITIETVSRQMTLMRKRGVIELPASRDNREVIVPNFALLAEHAEHDFSASSQAAGRPSCTNRAEAYAMEAA